VDAAAAAVVEVCFVWQSQPLTEVSRKEVAEDERKKDCSRECVFLVLSKAEWEVGNFLSWGNVFILARILDFPSSYLHSL
jgi:hypothetical protein